MVVWGRAKAHQMVRAGVPCVGGERVGRGAFSESSVPEPLSTDMRSCWKAANPGGVSRGAAVAGVRAASAMGEPGGKPHRLSARGRAFADACCPELYSPPARLSVLTYLCLSKLALVAASGSGARSVPYGPTAGRAARVRTAWHRAAGGRSQRACRPLRQAYHPAHDARDESRPRVLRPQVGGAGSVHRCAAPSPRPSLVVRQFPFLARGSLSTRASSVANAAPHACVAGPIEDFRGSELVLRVCGCWADKSTPHTCHSHMWPPCAKLATLRWRLPAERGPVGKPLPAKAAARRG